MKIYGIAVNRCFKKVGRFPKDSQRININLLAENYGISENRCFKKISHFPTENPFPTEFFQCSYSF